MEDALGEKALKKRPEKWSVWKRTADGLLRIMESCYVRGRDKLDKAGCTGVGKVIYDSKDLEEEYRDFVTWVKAELGVGFTAIEHTRWERAMQTSVLNLPYTAYWEMYLAERNKERNNPEWCH